MVVKSRRKGARSWARNSFAFMWIALGGLSSLYLFTLFNDPVALASYTGGFSRGVSIPAGPGPLSPAQVASLNGSLDDLAAQTSAINSRLEAVEIVEEVAEATPPPEPDPVAAAEPAAAPMAPAPVEIAAQETEIVETVAAPVQIAAADPVREPEPLPVREPEPLPVREAEPLPEPQLVMPDAIVAGRPPAAPPPAVVSPPPVVSAPIPAPEPVTTTMPVPSAEIAILDPAILPRTANDGSTRYGIELGAVSKREGLRPLWRELLTEHAALVAGLQPRRIRAPDKKWRLIAGPFANAQDAEGACSLFKKAGRKCAATVYAGDSL